MKQSIIALLTGIIFGLGLSISQMTDRERVLGFLDVTGVWDPTLIFVLGGAVGVTVIAFRFVLRRPQPFVAPKFQLPISNVIDRPLLLGSVLFGIGWGISGYCPGPGVTSLVQGNGNPVLFMAALIVGFLAHRFFDNLWQKPAAPSQRLSELADPHARIGYGSS